MPTDPKNEKRTKWLDAARLLIANRYEQVLCPECGMAFLTVEDNQLIENHFDRHLRCTRCGAHEVIFKKQA